MKPCDWGSSQAVVWISRVTEFIVFMVGRTPFLGGKGNAMGKVTLECDTLNFHRDIADSTPLRYE